MQNRDTNTNTDTNTYTYTNADWTGEKLDINRYDSICQGNQTSHDTPPPNCRTYNTDTNRKTDARANT